MSTETGIKNETHLSDNWKNTLKAPPTDNRIKTKDVLS